jgi:hypothetical protein
MPVLLELYEELKDKSGDKISKDLVEAIQELPQNERLKRIEDGIDKLRLWTEQGFKSIDREFKELRQSTDKEFKEIRQELPKGRPGRIEDDVRDIKKMLNPLSRESQPLRKS